MLHRVVLLGFGIRVAVAAWNAFLGPSFGAEGDASGLHLLAADYANGIAPPIFRLSLIYIYALGLIYRWTISSLFLGGLLSCLVWLASAYVLIAIMRLVRVGPGMQRTALLIYGVLPSSVLWTGVTMREPYQLLCVNLAVYAALRILLDKSHVHWLLLCGSIAFGTVLHATLLGWGLFLGAATAMFAFREQRRRITPARFLLAAVVAVAGAWLGYRLFTNLFSYPIDQGLAFAVQSYQRGGLSIGVRTDYRSTVEIADTLSLLTFVPVSLWQDLFEPMAWRVTSFADLIPVLENLLRFGLMAQAVATLARLSRRARQPALLVFLAFLVLETAWSLGTFNWGTAARHHIPGVGLLLAAAFAASSQRLRGTGAHDPPGQPLHAAA